MADPLQEPASKTPLGVISRFPTTHSKDQAWFYVTAVVTAVVPGTLLLLRWYTKLRIVRKVDWTDYLSTMSFVSRCIFLISIIIIARVIFAEGAGVHQWNLPMHNKIAIAYWIYVGQTLQPPALFLAKTAILLQYLRWFAPQKVLDPFMWYSARVIIIVAAIYYSISVIITTFACSPREAIWNKLIANPTCLDSGKLVFITSVFNITSDWIILLLPARAVRKLQIATRSKIRIVLLFAIGLLACIADVMVIFYMIKIRADNRDISYNLAWLGLWVIAEISLGITLVGTFLLPKFIEVEGPKLRGVFSNLAQPFASLMSGKCFGILMRRRNDEIALREAGPDTVTMIRNPESELSSINHDRDIERYPSYEDLDNSTKLPSVDATDTPHPF